MVLPGQTWPYNPSITAQTDYWNLSVSNKLLTEDEKAKRKKLLENKQKNNIPIPKNTATPIKTLESDMFANNNVRRLDADYWAKNKKKTKSLNTAERILKRIL